MASQLVESLARVRDQLTAAGIHAVLDSRDITPPCAWITVHDVTGGYLCGDLDVRADVALIVGDFGEPVALEQLGQLLDIASRVLAFEEPARPVTLTPPGIAPVPALVITTTTD